MKKIPCLFKRIFNDDHTATLLDKVAENCEWVLCGEGEASVKIDGTACAIINGELYARYDRKLKTGKALKRQGYFRDLIDVGCTVSKVSNKPFKNGSKTDVVTGINHHFTTHLPYAELEENPDIDLREVKPIGVVFPERFYRNIQGKVIPCQEPDPTTGHWPHWVKVEEQPEYKYHREGLENTLCHIGESLADGTYELIGPKVGGNPESFNLHWLVKHGEEVITDVERTFDGIREWLKNNEVEGLVFKHQDGRMCKIRRRDYGLQWPV